MMPFRGNGKDPITLAPPVVFVALVPAPGKLSHQQISSARSEVAMREKVMLVQEIQIQGYNYGQPAIQYLGIM